MSIKLAILYIVLMLSVNVLSQDDKVLFSYNGEKVTLSDFKNEFRKKYENPLDSEHKNTARNFLNDYVEFKLKVAEAKKQRLDKNDNFILKSNAFKSKVVKPHLADKRYVEILAKEAYDRIGTQLKVRQILIRVSPYADPKDTLIAYQKALSIRKELINGKNFNETAIQYSDDPSTALNKGDLGYIGPFVLPRPIENYIYNKNDGKYSLPLRSFQGYHIVKVIDRRKSPGYFKVAHILIQTDDDTSSIAQKKAEDKINSIYKELLNGANFVKLAKEYSDDYYDESGVEKLAWFYTGETPPEFENVCLQISNGAFSKPFKTRFGWHIIKRTVHKDILPYNQIKEQFANMILSCKRGEKAEKIAIRKLKAEYKFKDLNNITPVIQIVDSTIFEAKWSDFDIGEYNEKIFSFNGKTYTQKDFINYLKNNQEECFPLPINRYVFKRYHEFIENELLSHKYEALAENNNEISKLINSYNEIILSNSITEKELYNQNEDNSAIKSYYANNKDIYNNNYELNVSIFSYGENLKKVSKQLKKLKSSGASDIETVAKLKAKYDIRFKLEENNNIEEGENPLVDKIIARYKKGALGKDKLFVFENSKKIIWLNKPIVKTSKDYDEVKDRVIADYKVYSEKRWIQKLKSNYNLRINEDVFEAMFEN